MPKQKSWDKTWPSSMLHASCSVLQTPCSVPRAPCSVLRALRSVLRDELCCVAFLRCVFALQDVLHCVFALQGVFTLLSCAARRFYNAFSRCMTCLHCVFCDVVAFLRCVFWAVLRSSAMFLLHFLSQSIHFLNQSICFLSQNMRLFVDPQTVHVCDSR